MTDLEWGGTLCPTCNTNEIVFAEMCRSCYGKKRYQANKEAIKAYQRGKYVSKKATTLAGTVIHIHIHIHNDSNGGE